MNEKLQVLHTSAQLLKVTEEKVPERIDGLFTEMRAIQMENESLHAKVAHAEASSLLDQVEKVHDVQIIAQKVQAKDMDQLRNMVDELKQKLENAVILLAAENDQKVQLAAGVSKDLINRGILAGKLIKQAAQLCGGGGGGRPDMAQAGGKDPKKINEALQSVKQYVKDNLDQ